MVLNHWSRRYDLVGKDLRDLLLYSDDCHYKEQSGDNQADQISAKLWSQQHYGVVKPMDGVVPYRLEMQAKAAVAGYKNLYEYWGDDLYREVMDDSRILINLASKEYSKCIEKYLQPEDRYITCVFGEPEGGKIVQKGVYAKMARGEMVRFMAGIHAEEPKQMKDFDWSGYRFDEERSSDAEYVFIRMEIPGKGKH